jgi:hypothetical protein
VDILYRNLEGVTTTYDGNWSTPRDDLLPLRVTPYVVNLYEVAKNLISRISEK